MRCSQKHLMYKIPIFQLLPWNLMLIGHFSYKVQWNKVVTHWKLSTTLVSTFLSDHSSTNSSHHLFKCYIRCYYWHKNTRCFIGRPLQCITKMMKTSYKTRVSCSEGKLHLNTLGISNLKKNKKTKNVTNQQICISNSKLTFFRNLGKPKFS